MYTLKDNILNDSELMDRKNQILNGFNNGRDTTDGVGGQPPFNFLMKNKKENMKTITLKSSAIIKIDDLNNIWYVSDIDSVLGRVDVNGRFKPYNGCEFTSEMLGAISKLMDDAQKNSKETQD